MTNRFGMPRTNDFCVSDAIAFRAGDQPRPGMGPIDDDDEGFDFYADSEGGWPPPRHDEARATRGDFGLYDELAPYLADNEVVAMIEVGLDVDLDDVYHLVHGTWGRRPSRVGY